MTQNSVTINDPDDHVFYGDLDRGTVFTLVNGTPEQGESHCFKLNIGHACLETGVYITLNGYDEFFRLKCKIINSITLTRNGSDLL